MKQTVHVPPGIHRPCLKIKTEFKKIINEKALTFGEGFFILTAKVETVGIEPFFKVLFLLTFIRIGKFGETIVKLILHAII